MKLPAMIVTAGLMCAPVFAFAQTPSDLNSQVTAMDTTTASLRQTNVINKISGDFSSFLGADSKTVVTGLRTGMPIPLTSTTTTPSTIPGGLPVTTTTTTVITPPTGHMGFGNVYISLALAKQQLSTLGITQPTPQQLQAALTGGAITQTTGSGTTATTTTTNLQGVLTMRSQHMGWGQIAQKLGSKLGPVVSAMKSANHGLTGAAATSKGNGITNASGQSSGSSDSGIVSASGKSHGNSGQGGSNGKAGEGIVTASGKGGGNAYGLNRSGIVSGSGNSSGSNNGIVGAGGANDNGAANGKGHNK